MHAQNGAYMYSPIITKALLILSYYTVLLMLKTGMVVTHQISIICYSYDYVYYNHNAM